MPALQHLPDIQLNQFPDSSEGILAPNLSHVHGAFLGKYLAPLSHVAACLEYSFDSGVIFALGQHLDPLL